MKTVKRLKNLIRRLLWRLAGWPKRVTQHGPANVSLEVNGDLMVVGLEASNVSWFRHRVALRHSRLVVQIGERIEKLAPLKAEPAEYFDGKTLARGETLGAKIYFARRDCDAAYFAVVFGHTLFEFPIAPALPVGAIARRS